jgi:uncharacterized protein YyaL (SSP411 family)
MATKAWNDKTGLALEAAVKTKAAAGLKAVADWVVRNQVRHAWPRWDANTGRVPYHVHLKTSDYFLSTSWNTARTMQGMFSAYQVLGAPEYLEAAERGLEYIKSLQAFMPEFPRARGTFIEETPLGDHSGERDGVECVQALLAHYFMTGNKTSLMRTKAFMEWLIKEYNSECWPMGSFYLAKPPQPGTPNEAAEFIFAAAVIPLVQYVKVTGEKKYLTRCAIPMIEYVLKNIQHADGAFRYFTPRKDHHSPLPNDPTVYNDDGIGVAILCLWKATGKKRYLDAAVAYGDWWAARDLDNLPGTYAMLPAITLFLTDIARATGDTRYTKFMEAMAPKLFALQVNRDENRLVSGAFMGEDMAPNYRKGADAGDFISLRSISYGLLAMAKLAARSGKEWGPSYSAFGF